MAKRHFSLIAGLALVVAACGGATGSSTTAGETPSTTTAEASTTTVPAVEAVQLSYALSDGDEFQYEVGLDQHIVLSASGDAGLMGDEEVPGDAEVDVTGTATFTHTVSDGPEPGTYEVHITGEFTDVAVTGTVDGEPIDSTEAPEFAAIEPVDVTVVVDENGKPVAPEGGDDLMGGIFGGMGSLGSGAATPGLDFGQFVGPTLTDQEVGVGDTWSEEIEVPGLGEEPIVTSVSSTVTGVDQVDGIDVFVIDSTTSTSLIEFDLAEFFAGMFGAFLPEEATDEEKAEMEAMMADLRFLMTIDGTTTESTTLFDPEAGLARQSQTTASTSISMDMNVPDEETGEMVGFVMDMSLDQNIAYRLLSATDV